MAFQYKKFQFENGANPIFQLKQFLKLQGWAVTKSSDGTTYNLSGDQITHNGTGAGGMGNVNAWFVIQMPGATRSFCFQCDAQGTQYWRVRYSYLGFSGGSPSATTAPTATDQLWIQTNDGANYNSNTYWDYNRGTANVILCAQDTAPYGFWMSAMAQVPQSDTQYAGHVSVGGLMLDPLVAGSFAAGATAQFDPYVINRADDDKRKFLRTESLLLFGSGNSYSFNWGSGMPTSFMHVGGTNYPVFAYASTLGTPGQIPNSFYTGKDNVLPTYYVRPVSLGAPHMLGESTFLKYCAPFRPALSLLTTDAAAAAGQSGDRIVIGHCSLPWDGSSPHDRT